MSREDSMSQGFIDRRSFLRGALGVAVGIGVGSEILPEVGVHVNEEVAEVTGHPTGNASWQHKVGATCAEEENPSACVENYVPTSSDKFSAQVIAPIFEEVALRAIPSAVLDSLNYDSDNDPVDVIAKGTEPFRFTRKELVMGAASSVVFGLAHNITNDGIDTERIPASQTVCGFAFWSLMRRFGLGSSIAAHSAFNYRALRYRRK